MVHQQWHNLKKRKILGKFDLIKKKKVMLQLQTILQYFYKALLLKKRVILRLQTIL